VTLPALSLAGQLATAPAPTRLRLLKGLTAEELQALEADWRFWARPSQLPPAGDWTIWLRLAGRGEGKTWTGANWAHEQAQRFPGSRGHLVAPTAADIRDTMVEGPAGILAMSPRNFRPTYEPSKRKLTWPNESSALLFSADEPERLRGPQCAWAWADEAASWRYPEAFDQLLFGLRMGTRPRVVVTTTPKPGRLLREMMQRPDCIVSRGRTSDNAANLSPAFLQTVVAKYVGTRLGRQELDAELLEDTPGALWTRTILDQHRRTGHPALQRVVVAIDPAAKSREDSNETGILAGGLGDDGHGYILADGSGRFPPVSHDVHRPGWANVAVALYREHCADRMVAEVNNGGEMVEATLRIVDPTVSYKAVTASRGKMRRAEPVAALYEQGKIHHVGAFEALEEQMTSYVPAMAEDHAASPDRMDALVWLLTELFALSNAPAQFAPVRVAWG
jgi:phage terminase large subunit-like protein